MDSTMPIIDTDGLGTQLAALRRRIPKFAQEYRKGMPIWETVVMWVAEVWAKFEQQDCSKLFEQSANDLRVFMQEFEPEKIKEDYRQRMIAAAAQLRAQWQKIFAEKAARSEKRAADLADLRQRRPDLADERWRQVVCMAGDPETTIKPVNYLYSYLGAVVVFLLLLVVEGFAGYGIFEFSGTSYSAFAWSLITVIVLALSSHFGGALRAIVTANSEAQNLYKAKWPDGAIDGRGVEVRVESVD